MTRYDIRPAETYVGLVIHEKPDGEWVKWDDVELLVIKQAIVDEEKPEPYVAPLVFNAVPSVFRDGEWVVEYDKMLIADKIPTREAAERVAAIYNEVIP